jgi:hypothetical protein
MTLKVSNIKPNLILLECNHYELCFWPAKRILALPHFYCSTCKKRIRIKNALTDLVEQMKIKLQEDGKTVQITLPKLPDHKKALLKQLKEMQLALN